MKLCRDTIARMAGYVPGEQPKDRTYIKLNTNENPYPPSPAVKQALKNFATNRLRLYPDPVALSFRQAAGEQFGLPPEWIIAGNGSDDLLTIATRTFVDQGGALAHFDPSYSLYPVLAGLQGARAVAVPLTTTFDMPANAAKLAAGCSIFFVARPNAPTGFAYDLDKMKALCKAFKGIVWIDEAYTDFAGSTCVDLAQEFPNVVVSRTFSKSYSLAGLRLGYAVARPELIDEMMKAKDSYNVSTLTQVLGTVAVDDSTYMWKNVERIVATREKTTVALQRMNCDVLPSSANFLFLKPPKPAAGVFKALREKGILVRYFPGPRTGEFLRITIGTATEMAALVRAMKTILA